MKENKNVQDINPYEIDKLSRIPSWIVILILKYWAAAAAVFFSIIGGPDIGLSFDELTTDDPYLILTQSFVIVVILGLFMALFMNYIIRPIVRMMHNRRNNTFKFNMINVKGIKSLLLSLPYYFFISIVLFFVVIFMGSHGLVLDLFGTTGGAGIEPFSYGIYFIVVDGIFVLIKNLCNNILQRLKYKKQIQGE